MGGAAGDGIGGDGATAGTGATGGAGGAGATGGASGGAASGGSGGSGGGTPDICTFEISDTLSADIPTVGVIDWSTDLAGMTEARIEFSLDDPEEDELNAGSGGPISASESRALLLGLKAGRSYTYRIVATAGETVCVSSNRSFTAGTAPAPPVITRVAGAGAASRSAGFIVTCSYSGTSAMIIDTDGDVVWWTDVPFTCSRAHMDWDGEYLWMLKANPTFDDLGEVRRVRMDGSGAETITGLAGSHHDFAVLPGGTTAFLVWADEGTLSSDLVERSAEGTLRTVARLDGATLGTSNNLDFHANALRYYLGDDSYTVSDLGAQGIFELNRQGQRLWRSPMSLPGVHGHQLLANGNLLYFEAHNGNSTPLFDPSPVHEYSFSGDTETLVWSYLDEGRSVTLGDVQRLPNGNTLVTYSTDGSIHEITPAKALVQSLEDAGQLGYSTFRETLYGPPQ